MKTNDLSQVHLKPLIMGVINVTPDSFSDGGRFFSPHLASDQILRLIDEGADIIDIGAESSRPGAHLISLEEEWLRLFPVLKQIQGIDLGRIRVSIDTNKSEIMHRVIDYGVTIINDIKGGADLETLCTLSKADVTYIAMHMHQLPDSMQRDPLDGNEAIDHVHKFFEKATDRLRSAGFTDEKIWLDPGIGFGKTDQGNIRLLKYTMLHAQNYQLVVGISRKSFIGRLLGVEDPVQRDQPSKMLELGLMLAGVKVIRTHNVKMLSQIRTLI